MQCSQDNENVIITLQSSAFVVSLAVSREVSRETASELRWRLADDTVQLIWANNALCDVVAFDNPRNPGAIVNWIEGMDVKRITGDESSSPIARETVKMRHILILGILCLAGCQSTIGPFAPRTPQRVDDSRYTIAEQESRGRDRYAIPDDSRQAGPPSGNAYPLGR